MLKLQRTSREGIISVIFRDKELLFTRPFVVAFAIALGIHLGLFLIFQVTPFKIGLSDTIFPPTRVEVDTPSKESVLAHVIPTIPKIRGLPSAPVSGPVLLEHPKFLHVRPVGYNKVSSIGANAFMHIKNEIYQPGFNPLVRLVKKPLEIVISGPLAERVLISDGIKVKSLNWLSLKNNSYGHGQRVVYSVMVEGATGKVFWYEPKQLTQEPSIDKFAETVLKDMQFAADVNAISMSGEVEMHFNDGEK